MGSSHEKSCMVRQHDHVPLSMEQDSTLSGLRSVVRRPKQMFQTVSNFILSKLKLFNDNRFEDHEGCLYTVNAINMFRHGVKP